MNFLQLCQETHRKCGLSGSGPASVTGQTGEFLRTVNRVNEAWRHIQNMHSDWLWMRGAFSFDTVAGQEEYTPAEAGVTDLSHWWTDTLRIELASIGRTDRQDLPHTGYLDWRREYDHSTVTSERPNCFSVRPWNFNLLLGGTPDDIYTISGEYQKRASELSGNTDTPAMPEPFHMLIVYRAMRIYAAGANAPEVEMEGARGWNEWIDRLEGNQRPALVPGAPLLED